MNKENVAQNIKIMRKRKGMNQAELAHAIEQSPSSISMYERAERSPDLDTLCRIAEVFEVSLIELIFDINVTENDLIFLNMIHKEPYLMVFLDRIRSLSKEDREMILALSSGLTVHRAGWSYDEKDEENTADTPRGE